MSKWKTRITDHGKIELRINDGRVQLAPEQAAVLVTEILDQARLMAGDDAPQPKENQQEWEYTRTTTITAITPVDQPEYAALVLGFGSAFVGIGFEKLELLELADQIHKKFGKTSAGTQS